jgi:hypothetical protein
MKTLHQMNTEHITRLKALPSEPGALMTACKGIAAYMRARAQGDEEEQCYSLDGLESLAAPLRALACLADNDGFLVDVSAGSYGCDFPAWPPQRMLNPQEVLALARLCELQRGLDSMDDGSYDPSFESGAAREWELDNWAESQGWAS